MSKQFFSIKAVAVACVAASMSLVASAQIVQNGGFESGLTDWTTSGWGYSAVNGPSGGVPFDGSFYAETGCVGGGCITNGIGTGAAYLQQVLGTSAGTSYTLSFWFTTNGEGEANELDVLWNGTSVLDLGPNGTMGVIQGSGGIHSYEQFTVTGLVGTGSDTLTFLGRQDPGYNGLDDVSVDVSGAVTNNVPEPGTLLLVGALLPLAAAASRRRIKK